MQTLGKYYRTLLTETRPEYYIKEKESIDDQDELLEIDTSKIDLDTRIAMKSMKNGKSSGPGGISVQLIKYGGDRLR